MNISTKICAAGLLLGACSWASAVPMLSISAEGSVAAKDAEDLFKGSLQGAVTEDFEGGYEDGDILQEGEQRPEITSTGVATFKSVTAGSGGACDNGSWDCDNGLALLNNDITPFNGRFSVPEGDSRIWLDSMDAKKMTIDVAEGFNAIGFYMTDPNDSGGTFKIGGEIFDFVKLFGDADLDNGELYYISIYDPDVTTLAQISITSGASGDGYGIDRVTVGKVPEPGTLALLGLGLAGLGLSRRRKQLS